VQPRRQNVDRILRSDESRNVHREPQRHWLSVIDDEHLDVHIAALAHVHSRHVARLERFGQGDPQPVIARARPGTHGIARQKASVEGTAGNLRGAGLRQFGIETLDVERGSISARSRGQQSEQTDGEELAHERNRNQPFRLKATNESQSFEIL
jgi:hypothetical protein